MCVGSATEMEAHALAATLLPFPGFSEMTAECATGAMPTKIAVENALGQQFWMTAVSVLVAAPDGLPTPTKIASGHAPELRCWTIVANAAAERLGVPSILPKTVGESALAPLDLTLAGPAKTQHATSTSQTVEESALVHGLWMTVAPVLPEEEHPTLTPPKTCAVFAVATVRLAWAVMALQAVEKLTIHAACAAATAAAATSLLQ